ncbi:hypothetical protein H2248_011995 [Termitomyces sp. 'cryptogamus']|nr:hypothetical protein H2248_011995 [Termitomyces sp. 'cryptogamus']
MAQNYYQQPQYYQPQNIYQQLGAPQPQQQGRPQIQQQLALVQAQQTPSLVQQRLQGLQQQAAQSGHYFQQQSVHYQAPPPPPQQPSTQTPFAQWVGPQQSGTAQAPIQSQRRPLPQPRPGSTSPTRSRPLPAPLSFTTSESNIVEIRKSTSAPWSQPPSPTKSLTSTVESLKRGRASPPKFSIASISSDFGSSAQSSPSSPSSVSSLSADSFSGSPVRGSPVRAVEPATVPKALVPGRKVLPAWKPTLPDVLPPLLPTPPPNPAEKQAHQFDRLQLQPQIQQQLPQRSEPSQLQLRPQIQQQLLQRSQPPQTKPLNQQSATSQQQRPIRHPVQSAPPPPIPSHSKPKPKPPSIIQPQWAYRTDRTAIEQEDESEEDEDDEDEEEVEDEQTVEYYSSESEAESTGKVPPSPQYGIRDIPLRNTAPSAFPNPGPMPQPPAMVESSGPRTITSSASSASASGPGFGSVSGFQAGWSKQEPTMQSMTMRLATSNNNSGSSSVIGLPRPPMIGMGGSNQSTPTKRNSNLNLDDTPPRSGFISQRTRGNSLSSGQTMPQTPGKRVLPTPGGQSQTTPTQSLQRRPQSQISTTPRQQPPVMSTRPQSQIFRTPLKQEDGNGINNRGLQRSRSFGRGRELPKTPEKDQQSPREPRPQPQQPQEFQRPQRSRSQQPQPHQGFSPTIPKISIESPAPRGGRDHTADIGRMESESEGESEHGHNKQGHVVHSPVPVPLINIHPEINAHVQEVPQINVQGVPQTNAQNQNVPEIKVSGMPQINVSDAREKSRQGSKMKVYEVPGISVSGPGGRELMHSSDSGLGSQIGQRHAGLRCGGCGEGIVGRIVNAMRQRWHPACFRCTVCGELLEHVSSYEWEGKAYCHLDYHENFAPKCYSCKTPIYEERFISLDDPSLGKRAYHEQHFFCAECGDPFLAPSIDHPSSRTGELAVTGDGDFASDDVGFTVYRGHPYCEACHVRLRLPKCKLCKRSIRDRDQAVEALGGKWCWSCFVCKGCQRPFEDPSFFERAGEPYCENCFSIILRNEV